MSPENPKGPNLSETGPKPLTEKGIGYISDMLKAGKIVPLRYSGSQMKYFNEMGTFNVKNVLFEKLSRYQENIRPKAFWSEKLLRLDPEQHTLRAGNYGDLLVYRESPQENQDFHSQRRPTIIIPGKDVREVDIFSIIGKVFRSGFVIPTNSPRFPLDNGQPTSPEELEQILITKAKTLQPESAFHVLAGSVKVDPSSAGKEVLIVPFFNIHQEGKDFMKRDAVVIDTTERKLLPRVFYNFPSQQ